MQFVCSTPGSYEINAFVDGNKLPMCPRTQIFIASRLMKQES